MRSEPGRGYGHFGKAQLSLAHGHERYGGDGCPGLVLSAVAGQAVLPCRQIASLLITARSTLIAAITGVLIAAGLDGRRRQRDAMREVRRLLRAYVEAAAEETSLRGSKRRAEREDADRRANALLDEIDVFATEMPPRHLAGYLNAAVEVLRVKHSIYEPNENRVVWQVRRSTDAALQRASTTPLLWWWLYSRWRRATMTPEMQGYVDYLPAVYELYEQNYQASATGGPRNAKSDAVRRQGRQSLRRVTLPTPKSKGACHCSPSLT